MKKPMEILKNSKNYLLFAFLLAISINIAHRLGAFVRPDMSLNGSWSTVENTPPPEGFAWVHNVNLNAVVIITPLNKHAFLKDAEVGKSKLFYTGWGYINYAAELENGKWVVFSECLRYQEIPPFFSVCFHRFLNGCIEYQIYANMDGWFWLNVLFAFLCTVFSVLCLCVINIVCPYLWELVSSNLRSAKLAT